ncbi:MAG: YdbH domain-containing protein [Verrucomicrobiota bacterium]|nr:YdbH domain-containing protein [Verrucomicrobiota bacterium]
MEEKTHAGKSDLSGAANINRRFRRLYVMGGMVALLLCLVLIFWFSILPRLVEHRLIDAFRELGLGQVSLQVKKLGLGEVQVCNIRMDSQDSVAIGKITVQYKLGELMGGQLGTVDIEGLELKAVLEPNGVRFPQLENLKLSDEPMDRLPFEEISIRLSNLFLEDSGGASHIIPIESKLTRLEPKMMRIQVTAQEKNVTLKTDVLIGSEIIEVSGGTLALECQKFPVLGLSKPLHDVSLRLSFAGKISTDNITVVLKSPSSVDARLSELSLGDNIVASELMLKGEIINPWTLELTTDGFKTKGSGGQLQGRFEAQTMNWIQDKMRIEARALKTEIAASEEGLVFALQQGTELTWMPGGEFLLSRGISAKDFRVTVHRIDKPAQLNVITPDSWTLNIPEAKLELHSESISMKERKFACDSISADLNIQADISADNYRVNLLSMAKVTTGKIQYEVFQDAPLVEIEKTAWNLSVHEKHALIAHQHGQSVKVTGHVYSENMEVQQGGWALSARPLDVSLMTHDDGMELSNWRDTQLEFSPDKAWLIGKGIEADSLVLAADKIPSFKIPQEEDWTQWSLTKSNVRLTAEAKSISLKEAGVKADYLKIPMDLEIAFDESGLDLDLENHAEMKATGVRYEKGDKVIQVEASEWSLMKNESKPLVHLDTITDDLNLHFGVNGRDVEVLGNLVSMKPIPEVQIPVELRGDKIELSAQCTLAKKQTWDFEGTITDEKQNYAITIPSSSETRPALVDLIPALRDLDLPDQLGVNIAISNQVKMPALWEFGLNNLTIGTDIFPSITGDLRLMDGGHRLSAKCELIDGLMAQVEGNRTGEKQSYMFKIPPTKITDKSALGNLFHQLRGIDIGGTIGLEANSDGMASQINISLQDCSLASSRLSAIIEGVSGNIRINGVAPFITTEPQQITIHSARLGNMELVDGLTVFQLEANGIFVEEERWSLKLDKAGRFVARDFLLTPGQPVKANILVQDLDLGIWLGLLTERQVVASGKLSGQVPVVFNEKGAKLPFRLCDGAFLETRKPGKLQFKSAKWAGDWLESVDPRFRTDPVLKELRQSVVEALQDFHYTFIGFHYDEKTDNMRVAVRGEGKTRQGRVVKFDPTINIKPVASWINEAYNIQVLLAHLENLVDRDLDDLFGD